jgi:hypothetical protein
MKQFSVYHHSGKTNLSEWDYYMLFPKFNLLPPITSEKIVEGGKIFFTEGVKPERFSTNYKIRQENPYQDIPFRKLSRIIFY